MLFRKKALEFLDLSLYPWELTLGKTKRHSWKFHKIVLNSLEIPRPKTEILGIPHDLFLILPGYSTTFLLEFPHTLFLIPLEIPYSHP